MNRMPECHMLLAGISVDSLAQHPGQEGHEERREAGPVCLNPAQAHHAGLPPDRHQACKHIAALDPRSKHDPQRPVGIFLPAGGAQVVLARTSLVDTWQIPPDLLSAGPLVALYAAPMSALLIGKHYQGPKARVAVKSD